MIANSNRLPHKQNVICLLNLNAHLNVEKKWELGLKRRVGLV